MTRADKEIWNA